MYFSTVKGCEDFRFCTGLGWGRFKYLHGSLYGVMFSICDENGVIAEQCLHRVKAFSAAHITPPVSRLSMHKELGGDTAGTADPT